ncbi:MAG: lysozyme inhibitor LprI family protein [Pseudomonadota bacterium]
MRMRLLFRIILSLPATACGIAALAQDIPWNPDATEACLTSSSDTSEREACIGRSADTCIDTPDGYTTVGMSFCLGKEAQYWDARLNLAYKDLLAFETSIDAELAELGSAAPSMSKALREMQRAWITYRDTTCAYEASQFGGGTGSGPAAAQCVMRLTGAQALELEAWLAQKSAQ